MVHYAASKIMSNTVLKSSYVHNIKKTITMKQFFVTMFSNNEGTSHKRVLGTIGFLSLIVCLFLCEPAHKSDIITAVEYVTMATIFGTVIEKFTNNSNKKQGQE